MAGSHADMLSEWRCKSVCLIHFELDIALKILRHEQSVAEALETNREWKKVDQSLRTGSRRCRTDMVLLISVRAPVSE